MVSEESLIQWVYANRHKISFVAKEFDWARNRGIPLFDFEVRLEIDGHNGVGRGSDFDETTALAKGIGEAIERAVCASLNISTVGVAAHTATHLARGNARLETLERYAFDTHLKNGQNFIPFQPGATKFFVPGMRFFRMGIPSPYHALICILSDMNESFLGLACDVDLAIARDKAALEVLRNHTVFQTDPAKFHRAVNEDPNLWNCRKSFLVDVLKLLGRDEREASEIPLPLVISEKVETSYLPTLAGCPVVLERAHVSGVPS